MKTRASGKRQGDAQARSRDKEMASLRKEAKALRAENETLKKRLARLRAGVSSLTVYRFIQANRKGHSISNMATLLGISHAAYYKWLAREARNSSKAAP